MDRGEVAMPAILRLLDGAGLTLVTIGLHGPSLDDVFLRRRSIVFRDQIADPSVTRGLAVLLVLAIIAIIIGARSFGRAVA